MTTEPKPHTRYTVILAIAGQAVMTKDFDYEPFAASQADVWQRLYPTGEVTLTREPWEKPVLTRVEVHTHEFEFAHGRKPKGRGSWAFFFERGQTGDVFWHNGLYAEARAAAIAEAKRRGAPEIFVGS